MTNPYSADYRQPLTDFERAAGVVDHLATGTAFISPAPARNRVTARALHLQIGTVVAWRHPANPAGTPIRTGRVSRITDRFVEVRDSVGSEGILPSWIVSVAGRSVVRSDADALRDTANHHQGSRVHAADKGHQRDMRRAGLVGPRGGLTRRGSIAAERLRSAALDDAFGPL